MTEQQELKAPTPLSGQSFQLKEQKEQKVEPIAPLVPLEPALQLPPAVSNIPQQDQFKMSLEFAYKSRLAWHIRESQLGH